MRCLVLHLVKGIQRLDDCKHGRCRNQEVDDGTQKRSEVDGVPAKGHRHAGYFGAATGNKRDKRADDVCHQGVDDRGKRAADDHADGEVHHVTAADELLELGKNAFFPVCHDWLLLFVAKADAEHLCLAHQIATGIDIL